MPMESKVKVTRVTDNEWTISNYDSGSEQACLTEATGGGDVTYRGLYSMPFELTITRL